MNRFWRLFTMDVLVQDCFNAHTCIFEPNVIVGQKIKVIL